MSLAIGIITAPRPVATLEETIRELRRAGFSERLHVFAEPGSCVTGQANVQVWRNERKLGMWQNWLQAATTLLRESDSQQFLICEDDLRLAKGASAALHRALQTLSHSDWGYASLYTPRQNVRDQLLPNGWHAIELGLAAWGSLAYCFTRDSLRELLNSKAVIMHPGQAGTDRVVSGALQTLGRRTYFHIPSLCAHAGGGNSAVGHFSTLGMEAVDFDPDYEEGPFTQRVRQNGKTAANFNGRPESNAVPQPSPNGHDSPVLRTVVARPDAVTGTSAGSVSIIVAARNNGRYLAEAFESALRQTVPCEVVYSDDCSTDDSLDVASQFEQRGLVVLASPHHGGVCQARNRGAAVAEGEFLVFLDGDDYMPEDFVERHLEAMQPGVPFVYGAAQGVANDGRKLATWSVPEWADYDLWRRNTVNTSAMYRRWVFEAAGRWREGAHTMWDWDLAIRAQRFGTPRPSQAVLFYRRHDESWSACIQAQSDEGQTDIRTLVRRMNARLSVGSIISGRLLELFPQWISAVAQATRLIQTEQPCELVLLDNTGDRLKRQTLRHEASRYCNVFQTIRVLPYPETVSAATEAERRNRVAQFMAGACNRLRAAMGGDIHWIVEDDILVPMTAGTLLWETLIAGCNPPHAVTGCYRNRHVPERYVGGWWRNGNPQEFRALPETESPFPVDLAGSGCLMYWKARTPARWHSHYRGIAAHDWEWSMSLKSNGGSLMMVPQVRCRHVVDAEMIIDA